MAKTGSSMTGAVGRSPPEVPTTPNTRLELRRKGEELDTKRNQMLRRLKTRMRRVTRALAAEGETQAQEWL